MQVITTKYLSPTNTKGSRVRATGWRGSITVDLDHSASSEQSHALAVVALLDKWESEDRAEYVNLKPTDAVRFRILASGAMPKGSGYGFVVSL